MPEGDTLHNAARRVGAALVGEAILSVEAPLPRHRYDRWPERLAGRSVRRVDAHGKHLFLRFDGDLPSLAPAAGRLVGRLPARPALGMLPAARLACDRHAKHVVVQFDGPVLELMSEGRTHFDQRLAALGRDVLATTYRCERCQR